MQKNKYLYPFRNFLFLILLIGVSFTAKSIEVTNLLTEYRINPIGIDNVQPRLFWQVNSTVNGVKQTAYEIRCANNINNLKSKKNHLWSSRKIKSSETIHIKYDGKKLTSGERVYWQVRVWDQNEKTSKWSTPAFFEMGLLNPSDWKSTWIKAFDPQLKKQNKGASPYFRKSFSINKQIKSARAYISSCGLYELHINGSKISDCFLTPGYTSYEHRLQYQVYDVTKNLKNGENVVATILGNGWYKEFRDKNKDKSLAFILQLEIKYTDGTTELIKTDKSWKSSFGAITYNSIYNGETYNATKELENWNNRGIPNNSWKPVEINEDSKNLVATINEPIKAAEQLQPIAINKLEEGKYLIDFGQNLVGIIKLQLNGLGHKGETVTIKHSEVLDKNGDLYTESLRAAKQTNRYIIKGDENEFYAPRFTFQGFRFAEINGYPGELTNNALKAIVLHSNLKRSGYFECSDSIVNQLFKNVIWGQKGNFVDVPTDCPQRDERLGWTGDTQAFAPTGCFNMNSAAFYTKWLKDLAADQKPNGSVPWVVPDDLNQGGRAGWADAAVIVPWTLYLFYNDTQILKEQYESMANHVEFMKNRAGGNYLWQGDGQFGDWLSYNSTSSAYPGAYTDKDLIASAFFAYSAKLMSNISEILNRPDEHIKYQQLYNNIRDAFQKEYFTPNGRIMSNTQTAYCLAFEFDLVPDSLKDKAITHLVSAVNQFGHITTGFLGTPLISFVLSENGYYNEAYKLLMRKEFPGWLYPVTKGATTIWERWDGIKPDGSFQDKGMNSFNHYAYGAIANWMYQVIGGIQINEHNSGFKTVVIEPHPGGGITWANTRYFSLNGEIISNWAQDKNTFNLDVTIPCNTSGIVRITASQGDKIFLNNKIIEEDRLTYKNEPGFMGYEIKINSGNYIFKCQN